MVTLNQVQFSLPQLALESGWAAGGGMQHVGRMGTLLGFALQICAAGAAVIAPEEKWIGWTLASFGGVVFMATILWWLWSNWPFVKGGLRRMEPSHVIILGLAIALCGVIWQSRRSPLTPAVTAVPIQGNDTHLSLKFGPAGSTPLATDLANIWRWYALASIAVVILPDGQRKEIKSWNLFMTFERPVDAKQVVIEGGGLPQYEVKDRDSRSVVVAFLGDILDTSLKVRIDSSVGTKTEATKSDTPALIPPQSKYRWGPLADAEIVTLRSKLRNMPKPQMLFVKCGESDCRELADSFMNLFSGLGWDPRYENDPAAVNGIALQYKDKSYDGVADTIEASTNGRLKVDMQQSDLLPLRLIIGKKPS